MTSHILVVVGAIVGGRISNLLFNKSDLAFFDLGTWILAIVGCLIVAGIYGAVAGRGKASRAP